MIAKVAVSTLDVVFVILIMYSMVKEKHHGANSITGYLAIAFLTIANMASIWN